MPQGVEGWSLWRFPEQLASKAGRFPPLSTGLPRKSLRAATCGYWFFDEECLNTLSHQGRQALRDISHFLGVTSWRKNKKSNNTVVVFELGDTQHCSMGCFIVVTLFLPAHTPQRQRQARVPWPLPVLTLTANMFPNS